MEVSESSTNAQTFIPAVLISAVACTSGRLNGWLVVALVADWLVRLWSWGVGLYGQLPNFGLDGWELPLVFQVNV